MSRILMLATLLLALAVPASADPTVQVFGGRTSVDLSDDFLNALRDLNVARTSVRPARLRRGTAAFPIPGGVLDLETAGGDIFHLGGLTLSAGGTTVGLLNFIIDTTGPAVLTGIVVVDGDVFGRLTLFDLDLSNASVERKRRRLEISNVGLGLSQAAADALNLVFGVDAFVAGLDVGDADVKTRIDGRRVFKDDDSDGDSDSDSD